MKECSVCGESLTHPYTCNYCGEKHCSDHRLPEKHDCPELISELSFGGNSPDSGWVQETEDSDTTSQDRDNSTERRTVDDPGRVDVPPSPDFGDSSPDVADDGSIKGSTSERLSQSKSDQGGIIDWRKLWIDTKIHLRKGIALSWRLALVGLLLAGLLLLIGATVGTGIPMIDGPAQDLASGVSDFADTSVNRTEVEREVHREINERREAHGLRPLEWDSELRDITRYHSEDMAQNGYYAHTAPDGETLEDRYQRFNYNCRIETVDGVITSGSENIAYTYAGSDVEREDGSVVNHDYDETQIAEGLVNQWMNSPGHRENILRPYWQAEGIGISLKDTDGRTKVYATQNFC